MSRRAATFPPGKPRARRPRRRSRDLPRVFPEEESRKRAMSDQSSQTPEIDEEDEESDDAKQEDAVTGSPKPPVDPRAMTSEDGSGLLGRLKIFCRRARGRSRFTARPRGWLPRASQGAKAALRRLSRCKVCSSGAWRRFEGTSRSSATERRTWIMTRNTSRKRNRKPKKSSSRNLWNEKRSDSCEQHYVPSVTRAVRALRASAPFRLTSRRRGGPGSVRSWDP